MSAIRHKHLRSQIMEPPFAATVPAVLAPSSTDWGFHFGNLQACVGQSNYWARPKYLQPWMQLLILLFTNFSLFFAVVVTSHCNHIVFFLISKKNWQLSSFCTLCQQSGRSHWLLYPSFVKDLPWKSLHIFLVYITHSICMNIWVCA